MRYNHNMPDNLDPTTIEDLPLRQAFIFLLNQIESQAAHLQALQQEVQALRDENNHLKGEQGQPKIQPNKKQANLSSEKERRAKKPRPAKARRAHYQAITSHSNLAPGFRSIAPRCRLQRLGRNNRARPPL